MSKRKRQFFSCEICFGDIDSARAAMGDFALLGVESKIFEDVVDPYSPAIFVGAWCVCEAIEKESFEKIVRIIADRHRGSADCFGVDDHVPVPSDFGFTVENGRDFAP